MQPVLLPTLRARAVALALRVPRQLLVEPKDCEEHMQISHAAIYILSTRAAGRTTLAPATTRYLIIARAIFTLNFITLIATSFSTKRCWQQRRKNRILTAAAVTRIANRAHATARAALLQPTSAAANLAQYWRRALHRRRRVCKNVLLINAAILCLTACTADACDA
jgi:hypothetical protein